MARLPSLRMGRVPDAPALPVRDPWPGDPARGARLLRGRAGDRRRRAAAAAGRLGRDLRLRRRCARRRTASPGCATCGRWAPTRPGCAPAPWCRNGSRTAVRAAGPPARRGRRAHHRLARPLRFLCRHRRRCVPPADDGAAGRRRAQAVRRAAGRGAGRPGADRAEGPDRRRRRAAGACRRSSRARCASCRRRSAARCCPMAATPSAARPRNWPRCRT